MTRTNRVSLLVLLYALAYGTIMLSLDGIRPFEDSPYHRYQAEALLHGHLYLSDSIHALQPGLVWYRGHIQHVWGLGIGFWLVPFDALWHLFSQTPFPDRLALGMAFACLAIYSARTGLQLVKKGQLTLGFGVTCLIPLCPALWTLERASQQVYEETVLYTIVLSLLILVALIRTAEFGSLIDYFASCAFGSFAIWIRPTHAAYGLFAVSICSVIVWRRWHSWKVSFSGVALWLASCGLLLWTNKLRFGSPVEFGHRLTISSGSMTYLTRFGNPFRDASLFEAIRELFCLLFLSNPRGANTFSDDLFSGQSAISRWRRLDLSAFDPIFAILSVTALFFGILWFVRQRRNRSADAAEEPKMQLVLGLLGWSAASFSALFCFYVYYPAVASRYMLDFAPALTGFLLLLPITTPPHLRKLATPLLSVLFVYEIASAKIPMEDQYVHPQIETALPEIHGASLGDFNGVYTTDHHPNGTRIAGNSYGWDSATGIASDVVSVVLDRPRFVQLTVSERRPQNGQTAGKDSYRAQFDGVSLPLHDVSRDGDLLKVTFDVPRQIRNRTEFLFLCFSDNYDESNRDSERYLISIAWK